MEELVDECELVMEHLGQDKRLRNDESTASVTEAEAAADIEDSDSSDDDEEIVSMSAAHDSRVASPEKSIIELHSTYDEASPFV